MVVMCCVPEAAPFRLLEQWRVVMVDVKAHAASTSQWRSTQHRAIFWILLSKHICSVTLLVQSFQGMHVWRGRRVTDLWQCSGHHNPTALASGHKAFNCLMLMLIAALAALHSVLCYVGCVHRALITQVLQVLQLKGKLCCGYHWSPDCFPRTHAAVCHVFVHMLICHDWWQLPPNVVRMA
jgi:hypothetical protein